jgi:hypothetical protein
MIDLQSIELFQTWTLFSREKANSQDSMPTNRFFHHARLLQAPPSWSTPMNPLSMHRTLGSLTLRNGVHEACAFHDASATPGDIASGHFLERGGPDVVNYVQ